MFTFDLAASITKCFSLNWILFNFKNSFLIWSGAVKLSNKILKLKTEENRLLYAKQGNYCVKLLQQKKRQYFENLNLSSITKLLWKTLSLLFTENDGSKNNKIILVEGGKVLTDDAKIAETSTRFLETL